MLKRVSRAGFGQGVLVLAVCAALAACGGQVAPAAPEPAGQEPATAPERRPLLGVTGVEFSEPVGGLAIGLKAPERVPVTEFRGSVELYVVASPDKATEIVFNAHLYFVQMLVYDKDGRRLTLEAYGQEVRAPRPSVRNLQVLRPGQVFGTRVPPLSLPAGALAAGRRYQLEAVLVRAPEEWWAEDVLELVRRYQVPVWEAAEVRSPRVTVELY